MICEFWLSMAGRLKSRAQESPRSLMKKLRFVVLLAGLVFLPLRITTQAEVRILNDTEWRADVAQTAAAIRKHHPRPFRNGGEAVFQQTYEALIGDVPALSDKEVILRLAGLVALIDDGHTRLTIPRLHPEIGLEFGHTSTTRPVREALAFNQLPVAFEQFADGVFIIAASRKHANSIGLRVLSIDGTPIEEALKTMQAITPAENQQLETLMGVDRLTSIDALAALGISKSIDTASIEVIDGTGTTRILKLGALPPGPVDWIGPFDKSPLPLRLQRPERAFWSEYVRQGNYLYAHPTKSPTVTFRWPNSSRV